MVLFGVQLKWLPAIGGGNPDTPLDLITYLVLPSLTLGLVMTASVARLSRSAMLSGLTQEYVRTSLQSIMVVYSMFVVGINLITDVAYGFVDPRIR